MAAEDEAVAADEPVLTVPSDARPSDLPRLAAEAAVSEERVVKLVPSPPQGRILNSGSPASITPPAEASNRRQFAPVKSTDRTLVELEDGSRLAGRPGETVEVSQGDGILIRRFLAQVAFLLTNLGRRNYFSVLARESDELFGNGQAQVAGLNFGEGILLAAGGAGGGRGDASGIRFLIRLSEVQPLVEARETRRVVLTLRAPPTGAVGQAALITLEVQPGGEAIFSHSDPCIII